MLKEPGEAWYDIEGFYKGWFCHVDPDGSREKHLYYRYVDSSLRSE